MAFYSVETIRWLQAPYEGACCSSWQTEGEKGGDGENGGRMEIRNEWEERREGGNKGGRGGKGGGWN